MDGEIRDGAMFDIASELENIKKRFYLIKKRLPV